MRIGKQKTSFYNFFNEDPQTSYHFKTKQSKLNNSEFNVSRIVRREARSRHYRKI